MSVKRTALDNIQRDQENKIPRLEEKEDEKVQMENSVIGNSGCSSINHIILSCLDQQSQMLFRSVCQSWKEQVDQPYFWIKKLQSRRQPKNVHDAWIDLIGRIEKGSNLEKELTKCLMKWFGKVESYSGRVIDGMTPIFVATRFGYTNIVKFIATYTDNLNAPKTNGVTPLHIAAKYGSTGIFKFLASKVEDPNVSSPNGLTPLHIAAKHGSTEIFKFLAPKVDKPNAPDADGWTLLHCAARYGRTEIFKFLAPKVDNPNAADNIGWTPLHCAARYGSSEIFKFLAPQVENPNAPALDGWTPLGLSARSGSKEIFKFLAPQWRSAGTMMIGSRN